MSKPDDRAVSDMLPPKNRREWVSHEVTANGDVLYHSQARPSNSPGRGEVGVRDGAQKTRGHPSHSRSLSDHFLDATNLSDPQNDDPGNYADQHTFRHGSQTAGNEMNGQMSGQKHRRVFSGGKTNPSMAHRRIDSGGCAAFVHRHCERSPPKHNGMRARLRSRSFSPTPPRHSKNNSNSIGFGHRRDDSAGLDLLTVAAKFSEEEIAEAAGGPTHPYHSHNIRGSPPLTRSPLRSSYSSASTYPQKSSSQRSYRSSPIHIRPSQCYPHHPLPSVYPMQQDRYRQINHHNYQDSRHRRSDPLYQDELHSYPGMYQPTLHYSSQPATNPPDISPYPVQYARPPYDHERKLSGLPNEPHYNRNLPPSGPYIRHRPQSSLSSIGSDGRIDTDEVLFKESMPPPRNRPSPRTSPPDFRASPKLFMASLTDPRTDVSSDECTALEAHNFRSMHSHTDQNAEPNKSERQYDGSTNTYPLQSDNNREVPPDSSITSEEGGVVCHHRKYSSFTNDVVNIFCPDMEGQSERNYHVPFEPTKHPDRRSSSRQKQFGDNVRDIEDNLDNRNFLSSSVGSHDDIYDAKCRKENRGNSLDEYTVGPTKKISPKNMKTTDNTNTSGSFESPSDDSATKTGMKRITGGTSKRVRRKCSVAECKNRVVQGGLCIAHGAKRKICGHPGCTKHVKKAGMCSGHGPPRKQCMFKGCTKVAVQGGKCIAHGAKKKLCSIDDCTKQAILSGMCKKHHDLQKGSVTQREGKTKLDFSNSLEETEFCIEAVDPQSEPPMARVTSSAPKKIGHRRGLSIFQEMSAVDKIIGSEDVIIDASHPSASDSSKSKNATNDTFKRSFSPSLSELEEIMS